MLDYRWQTFLLLCKTLSYTKTANELHVSQPTITHQIQYLEEKYQVRLFEYRNRKLQLTLIGEKIYQEVVKLELSNQIILSRLRNSFNDECVLRFWCTLTFGEYILPELLSCWIDENPALQLQMQIRNTTDCLSALEQGEIDFAFVEGYFNKAIYQSEVIKSAEMILVVASDHELTKEEKVTLDQVTQYSLIIHQKESRLRGILPSGLSTYNYAYENFAKLLQVGNANVMKQLVKRSKGVAFLYEDIVREELKAGTLVHIPIEGFVLKKELSMVYLNNRNINPMMEKIHKDVFAYCN